MFKAVADAGGFNQAALLVHKSQSSIHHAVGKLESSLGVKLLLVEGRRTVLTEVGKLLLSRAQYLLEESSRVEAVAQSLGRGVETRLKIAIDSAFPQKFVFDALKIMSVAYPQLHIDVFETVLSGANELVSQKEVDIALSPIETPFGLNEEICRIDFIAVAHKDHPLSQKYGSLSSEQLKSYRQIVVRDSAQDQSVDVGWLEAEQRWTVSDIRSSIDLLEQNFGFAWLPLPAISSSLESGLLKPLALREGRRRSQSFFLNYLDGDKLGPAARDFVAELQRLVLGEAPANDSEQKYSQPSVG